MPIEDKKQPFKKPEDDIKPKDIPFTPVNEPKKPETPAKVPDGTVIISGAVQI